MPRYVSVDEGRAVLAGAQRVMVVGCSGGGKTTLSLQIAERFGLAYQSMDRDVRWLAGWVVRDSVAQREIVEGLVAEPRWVMDGTSPSTFDLRVPRVELILWVRVPRRVALWGLAGRVLRNYGRVRVAMAEGCPEPLPDWEFLSYIWTFERKAAPQVVAQIDRYGPQVPVVVLRRRQDIARLLQA